jgi:hypothetical protein
VVIFTLLGVTQADLLLAMGVISHLIGAIPIVIVGCVGVVWLGASFEEIFSFKKYVTATDAVTTKKLRSIRIPKSDKGAREALVFFPVRFVVASLTSQKLFKTSPIRSVILLT